MARGKWGREGQTVCTWMEPELVARLDRLAKQSDTTRSNLIMRILRIGSKRLEQASGLGVVRVSVLLNDLDVQLESWVHAWQDDPQAMKESSSLRG